MGKKIKQSLVTEPLTTIDVACVIHSHAYDWTYVDRLFNMVRRNLSLPVRFHVYTESTRAVPAPMIKHELPDLGIGGPKQSWWYKLQIFNPAYHNGPLLYFDLDTVIANRLDWIYTLPLNYFWAVRDFKYLWRPASTGINSSVMWFDTRLYDYVYRTFMDQNLQTILKQYKGDQDFISEVVHPQHKKYLDSNRIKSWRWEVLDGGYNFRRRSYVNPGSGASFDSITSVIVFHGHPKPQQVLDSTIQRLWV
jgi:hypothetical protein